MKVDTYWRLRLQSYIIISSKPGEVETQALNVTDVKPTQSKREIALVKANPF